MSLQEGRAACEFSLSQMLSAGGGQAALLSVTLESVLGGSQIPVPTPIAVPMPKVNAAAMAPMVSWRAPL